MKQLLDATLADLRGWEWDHFKAMSDMSLRTLTTLMWGTTAAERRHPTFVSFTPDGRRIVLWDDAEPVFWDAETGGKPSSWQIEHIRSPFFSSSPDGRQVVLSPRDCTLRLLDAETGAELSMLHGAEEPILAASFSPDARRIASMSEKETLIIWDVRTGVQLQTIRGHGHDIRVGLISFSPDGRRIVSGAKTAR